MRHRLLSSFVTAAAVLAVVVGARRLDAQASRRPADAPPFFIGVSVMNDRLDDHFDHRPIALGIEGDYSLLNGPALRGGAIRFAARAHYYSNASILGDTPPYSVTSFAAGIAYHPFDSKRFDPYAGFMARQRSRTKSQADSTTTDALLDIGARLRLGGRVSAQTGMSFGGGGVGLWRVALMFGF